MQRIKCIMVGDGAVGKRHVLATYMTRQFPEVYMPQSILFMDGCRSTVMIGGESYDLDVNHTPGQEDYDRLRPLSYREVHVFLVCFSVVSPSSFDNVKEKWVPEILHHCPKTPFLLVGTKIDLRDDGNTIKELQKNGQRPISIDQAEQLSREVKAVKYVECSALTQEGLKNVFDEAIMATIVPPKKSKCALL